MPFITQGKTNIKPHRNLFEILRGKYILIIVILAAIVAGGILAYQYWWLPKEEIKPPEFKGVMIKELIEDIIGYDGQKVLVEGKYTKTSIAIPQCMPTGTGKNPVIEESYKIYPATWGISNQDGIIGVEVIDENGVHISTLPNYKENQEIELKGIVKVTTVADECNRDIVYKSLYLEVKAQDVDITLKPLPEGLPTDETANWKTYRNEEYGFEIKYPPENFLSGEPEVMVADCENINFPTECPEAEKIIGHSIPDFWFETKGGKTTINNTPYCFYLWSEGAAGSVYSNYYYTTVKNKKCLTAYFLIISTNCGVLGSPGEEAYEQCNYKNDITKPKILSQILSTFRFSP